MRNKGGYLHEEGREISSDVPEGSEQGVAQSCTFGGTSKVREKERNR